MGFLLWGAAGCQTSPEGERPAAATPTPSRIPEIGVDFATRVPPTAVVVEVPTATPLPPPTITPTPTPIVYEIIEGDTVLGIAISKNTTTEAILALNPGVNPNLLQIGATLILPPPATPVFAGGAATPVPVDLGIGQINLFQTASGRTWIIGELLNQGDFWVTQARLKIAVEDAGGGSLGEQPAWTAGPLIGPGEAAPFGLLWPGELPDDARPVVAVEQADGLRDPFDPDADQFVFLEPAGLNLASDDEGVILQGVVLNPGGESAASAEIIVSWHDRAGRLVGFASQTLGEIPAGGSLSFEIDSIPPGGRPGQFEVVVWGIQR